MIRRRAYLKRYAPPPRKRSKPRRSGRVRDVAYLLAVKLLPWCATARYVPGAGMCDWAIEADHAGPRPLGRKANDDTAIPNCTRHHRMRTDYSGVFAGWDDVRMREWCDRRIEETRTEVERARVIRSGGVPW